MPDTLPATTRDPEQALSSLREYGLCLVAEVLDGATLARVCDAL